jgi:acetyl esterase/lipase
MFQKPSALILSIICSIAIPLFLNAAESTADGTDPGVEPDSASEGSIGPYSLEGISVNRDLVYSDAGPRPLALDLYKPADPSASALPVIVYIHGGGYRKGSKNEILEHPFFSNALLDPVAQGKYALASIDFSKGSKRAPLEVLLTDCDNAIQWLRNGAADRELDPERIGIVGNESGGLLALNVGLRESEAESQAAPLFVIAHAPATDLTKAAEAVVGSEDEEKKKIRNQLKIGMEGTLDEVPENYRDASPVNHVAEDSPPVLITVGENDAKREHAEWFGAAAEPAGANARIIVIADGSEKTDKDPVESTVDHADLVSIIQVFVREHL